MIKLIKEDHLRMAMMYTLIFMGGMYSNTWMVVGGVALIGLEIVYLVLNKLQPLNITYVTDPEVFVEMEQIKNHLETMDFKVNTNIKRY